MGSWGLLETHGWKPKKGDELPCELHQDMSAGRVHVALWPSTLQLRQPEQRHRIPPEPQFSHLGGGCGSGGGLSEEARSVQHPPSLQDPDPTAHSRNRRARPAPAPGAASGWESPWEMCEGPLGTVPGGGHFLPWDAV